MALNAIRKVVRCESVRHVESLMWRSPSDGSYSLKVWWLSRTLEDEVLSSEMSGWDLEHGGLEEDDTSGIKAC